MELCNESCSSVQLACRLAYKKLLCWTLHESFSTILFILAVLVGTIDFYHLVTLSLTLTLAGRHKVSAKQNTLASFSRTFFSRSG